MNCANCGRELNAEARFCTGCGAPFEIPAQKPPAKKKTRPPKPPAKKLSAGAYVAAVFLSILLFILGMSVCVIIIGRSAISPQMLVRTVDELEISTVRVGVMFEMEGRAYEEDFTVAEWLYYNIHNDWARDYDLDISYRAIRNLLESQAATDFIADIADRYVQAVLNERSVFISNSEIVHLVRANEQLFYRETGIRLVQSDYDRIRETLVEIEFETITRVEPSDDFNAAPVRLALSNLMLGIFIALAVLTLAGIFFTLRMRLVPTGVCAGVVLIVNGVFFTVFSLITAILEFIPEADADITHALLSGVRRTGSQIGLGTLAAGVVIIVAVIIVKAATRKKSNVGT